MLCLAFQFLFHQNLTRIKLRTSYLPKRVLGWCLDSGATIACHGLDDFTFMIGVRS